MLTTLGQIASIRMGYPFRSRVEHDASAAVVVIQMKDIDEENRVHPEGAARVQLDDLKEHHLLRENDLVFRSRGQTNSVALVEYSPVAAVLAAPLLLIRASVKVLPGYLQWFINLPATQTALAGQSEGTSVRMISKAALEALELPLPSLGEQERIVAIAELTAREQALLERIAHERKRLADGILLRAARESR